MIKYYTRACNFYYGNKAKTLIKKKLAFPLCGSSNIAFDNIEIFKRRGRRINKRSKRKKNKKQPREKHKQEMKGQHRKT